MDIGGYYKPDPVKTENMRQVRRSIAYLKLMNHNARLRNAKKLVVFAGERN